MWLLCFEGVVRSAAECGKWLGGSIFSFSASPVKGESAGGPWGPLVQQQQLRLLIAAELRQQVRTEGREDAATAAAAAPLDSLQRVLQQLPLGEAAARLGVHRSTIARWGRLWSQKQQQPSTSDAVAASSGIANGVVVTAASAGAAGSAE
ncbi:hypothetical protein cyc_01252 [Cyclospora cayetanensis]|uniref:Uncharacterized protein n=1 Tax=Cyclospora cayetanensis TaxID=88456 RepID=A0A1D3CYW4_9EIME|nr:hypothetical protein cyc_01252 [Cyclospora cayetanensis]